MPIQIRTDDNATVRRLIDQLNVRLQFLEPGKEYQLEDILGPEFWADEEDSNNALGHHFSGLVRNGRVPFTFDGWTKDRHNKYQYTP